jgi:YVTN family beta-propeller protein
MEGKESAAPPSLPVGDGDATQGPPADVRTFLIADLRGYTRFTQEQGDEAASHLATRFAEIVRATVPRSGGELLELRGDEALCVFRSAREALGSALKLQRQLRETVEGKPAIPLGVGIGIDAGEAVPTNGGYRGRALNVASRLCALARPGEILASETVATLAGRPEGASYARRRPARLKGLEEPVRHVEVVPDLSLPPLPTASVTPRRRRLLVGVLALAAAAAAAAAILLSRTDGGPTSAPANSLAIISPGTNELVGTVAVGERPGSAAVAGGRVWVINEGEQTVSLVDADTRSLKRTVGFGVTPAGLALGLGRAWVADATTGSVVEVSPDSAAVVRRIDVSDSPARGLGGIAFGLDSLWLLNDKSSLSRIDPDTGRVLAKIQLPGLTFDHLAVAADSIWVAGCCVGMVRVDAGTGAVATAKASPDGPIAIGFGSLWVADPFSDEVWQIDPRSGEPIRTLHCQGRAFDVAVGEGSVWVACGGGTVLRVNPSSGEVVRTIEVGGTPAGIAVGEGAVWVAVS